MSDKFKKSLCEAIVDDYCLKNDIRFDQIKFDDVRSQSSLGVALQYLGFVDNASEEIQDYIKNRRGVISAYSGNKEPFVLTLRDILEN